MPIRRRDAATFCRLADAYQRYGRSDLAGAFYLEALYIEPSNRTAIQGLSRLCVEAGRYDVLNYYFERMQQARDPRPRQILIRRPADQQTAGN